MVLPAVAACALLGLVPSAARSAAGAGAHPSTAADTATVENRAYLSYSVDGGQWTSSAAVSVKVQRPAVEVVPSYEATMEPGGRRAFAHRVVNGGTAAGRFRLEAAAPAGWRVSLFLDVDGDGELGARDAALSGPVALDGGASAALLLLVEVPQEFGGEAELVLRATSETDPAATAAATDRVTVARGRTAASLEKAVDRTDAGRGDTLAYTLTFANRGVAVFPDARLHDPLPGGLRFVPGSLRLNGAALSDAADADAGSVEREPSGRQTVAVKLGALAPGASGSVAFRAVVEEDAPEGTLANVAMLTLGDHQVASTPAGTQVGTGRLEVSKERVGTGVVHAGGELTYRVGWANRSPAAVRDVVLTDTLPAELVLLSAEGSPEVQGQVVRWKLGTLQPGASGAFALTARVAASAGGRTVVNRAVVQGSGASAATAAAAPVPVAEPDPAGLELRKSAGSLEAGVGETVVYTLVVRNPGDAPLEGVVVLDLLPEGTRLVEGSVWGADSSRVSGRELRLALAGALAPGAERTVRYALALVSPGGGSQLGNRAWAEAAGGRVRSDTATAWVRLRRGHAMQGRTLIGKVWLDEDGDGRQGPGERGIPGAGVWSEDGQVVTTDREGRFSFRDLRPGTHVLRLDTLGLPAGYTVARRGEELLTIRMDGWTAPRAAFRLVKLLPGAAAAARGAGPSGGDDGAPAPGAPGEAARKLPPRIAPLRTEEERAGDRAGFLEGPGVAITAPADGSVIGTNRLYLGVRGEAGAPVRLYDGDRLVKEDVLRPDGSYDFIGVEVAPGPHRFRVWTLNSWKRERWDSVAVHRSGSAARIETPAKPVTLRADVRAAERLRLRVLDRWGVLVADTPNVTVEIRGAALDGADVDASSVGTQLRTGADGWLELTLRAREVGTGELRLASDTIRGAVPFRVLPFVRPLIATGAAQVGVGAAPDAFGAVTVQGALNAETSVSVSYDSRRSDPEGDFFAHGYDPLDESRYPTFGDASERRVLAGTTQTLSARVERGFDWLEAGDVMTRGFGADGSLGAYRRALTGVAGRVSGGALAWSGFGSVTDQALEQRQLRGDGSSGPYRLGGGIRPGTERVAIEVRAAGNAARVVARQELSRYTDYQVDYLTGTVLLQRPVPSTDPQGNPVYVVATVERRSGGEARFVGGLRMELDAARLMALRGVDSLGVGFFGVRDAAGTGSLAGGFPGAALSSYDLFGGDFRVRSGRLEAGAELLHATGDSAATAGQAELAWSLPGDRFRLEAGWLRVGDGFAASANPRLVSEMDEVRVAGSVKLPTGSTVTVRHERQAFHEYGVERSSTLATATQEMAGRKLTAEGGITSDLQDATDASSSSATGKATLGLTPDFSVWLEGSHLLRASAGALGRPDHVGAGASYRVLPGVRVEGAHRFVRGADSAAYSFTSLGLRMESVLGGQVWGDVEATDGGRGAHSLALGWNQRLSMTGGWALTSLFERRFGLSHAPLADPLRALPFARPERDRWSAGLGLEWLPADSAARFSARGEVHDGEERSGYRFDVAGDLPLGPSMSLLTRHDWSSDAWPGAEGDRQTRRDRSLVGFALRPVGSDAVNALAKLEWRRSADPLFGGDVLTQARDEARLIGSADAIWAPSASTELAGRYAIRWSMTGDTLPGASDVQAMAHYLGGRYGQALRGPLSARLDGRMLLEGTTGTARWSATPSLVMRLGAQLELEGGWRLGDLRDPDFFAFGGSGPFAALGIRLTEGTLDSTASFWRERIRREF
ncbi:MAG: SdrD B-like domain-containing protein [Gemmatimonadota bacterium]